MNYMSKIAEMLGVELGEEFKIKFESGVVPDDLYMLTDNAIYMPNVTVSSENLLWRLLTGRCEIVKLPWKPKDRELVWYVDADRKIRGVEFSDSNCRDLFLYKLGMLYRSLDGVKAHIEKNNAYWDEIRKELEE